MLSLLEDNCFVLDELLSFGDLLFGGIADSSDFGEVEVGQDGEDLLPGAVSQGVQLLVHHILSGH